MIGIRLRAAARSVALAVMLALSACSVTVDPPSAAEEPAAGPTPSPETASPETATPSPEPTASASSVLDPVNERTIGPEHDSLRNSDIEEALPADLLDESRTTTRSTVGTDGHLSAVFWGEETDPSTDEGEAGWECLVGFEPPQDSDQYAYCQSAFAGRLLEFHDYFPPQNPEDETTQALDTALRQIDRSLATLPRAGA